MAHVKVESVSPAIAGAKKFTIELPHRWWQWVIAVILAIIIVFTGLFLSGMHTGRIGFVPVEGNSMQSVFPWGTAVFVLPITPKDGDYVVALIAGEDNPETQEDRRPSLIVKRLEDELLVSTDSGTVYGDYELHGVVIGQLPIQKICWWMDKGSDRPAPDKLQPAAKSLSLEKSRVEMFERTHKQVSSLEAYQKGLLIIKSNYSSINADPAPLLDDDISTSIEVILNDKDLEVSIDFRELGSGVTCEVIPAGGSIPFEEHKAAGRLDLRARAMEGPPFFLAGMAEIRLWRRR